ncbi:TlpA family protein disulfide reductase [Amphibacillus sediminis]|uniref:TlpA family protein disulfide reductase n=1 Tax=Amphibacillus sediminis TaxID=360185 RepID=UPI000830CC62|nr:TlpA disulfide reductase family protein [Amphibacillus sediminis]
MKAPEFTLPYLDQNQTYTLSQDRGKIIILTFWASWCPDCSSDLPLKERLYQTVDAGKVSFITINVSGRERNQEDALRYHQKFISQPTLVDRGLEVYRLYQCLGVPTTVVISQTGEILKQFTDQAKPLEIMAAISQLL